MRLAIKTEAQSHTNRASGWFQDGVGGRSAPFAPLLSHKIASDHYWDQTGPQSGAGTSHICRKEKRYQRRRNFLVGSFSLSFTFCFSERPPLCAAIHTLISYNLRLSKVACVEKALFAAVLYSSGHLCIICLSFTFQSVNGPWARSSDFTEA